MLMQQVHAPNRHHNAISDADRSLTFGAVSVLLGPPDGELVGSTADLMVQVRRIDDPGVRRRLTDFLDWLDEAGADRATQHHTRIFGARDQQVLRMTSYLRFDAQRRYGELDAVQQLYLDHGLRLASDEHADLLCVVLEFAAIVGPGDGELPLQQHRTGVERLRAHLSRARSPYAQLLDAVDAALGDQEVNQP